ncbi:MAG: hypothetical protein P4L80_06510 [Xanthobacteraceae bacterium]|nr:hypothetical protein [Xanthobacteraceae bacterium]
MMKTDPEPTEERFPLSIDHMMKVKKVIQLMRNKLPIMHPGDLRTAAVVLIALERLPATTACVDVTFGFSLPNTDGNYGWVDIHIDEQEFRLASGEHFYDPSIGGDTQSRTVFETQAGGGWYSGDIDEWLECADRIASEGQVDAEDNSDHDGIEWDAEGEQVL